jgi:glyoxylase-like metal-dependent hydrolase (beta-lactamase superfamily II)
LLSDEPQVKISGGFVTRITQATRLIGPDDQVGSLRVIAAPGHSPDQIAFYDERDGTLIAGDAFQTKGGIAVAGITRWLFPFPGLASWHLPTALQSAIALRALDPARLAVGHGNTLERPAAQMDKAIQEAQRRIGG